MILIWFRYVLLFVDTGFEISTVPDVDNYSLAYSPSISHIVYHTIMIGFLSSWNHIVEEVCNAV